MAEQQLDDVVAGGAVEIARRLVREHDHRLVGQRPRDRDALLLAARQLRRVVMAAILEPDFDEQAARARGGIAPPGDFHRHEDVLERGQRRDEMKGLEHEADLLAAQPRELDPRRAA